MKHGSAMLDDEKKAKVASRLKRIEGQVRGVGRMIDEGRYCPEILTQISAVQESLRSVAEILLHSHLRHCVANAARSNDPHRAEEMYAELTNLFQKYSR